MKCSTCSRELPSGFPGATITCLCGAITTLEVASLPARRGAPAERSGGGPYRSSSSLLGEVVEMRCPFCGNACPPLARVCPHCDVRLDNVRCVRCYTLQPPGSFACARCGKALELEPLLDATDAPCPRCRSPLEAAASGAWDRTEPPAPSDDPRVHECPRCGGMFVPREALADILCRAELLGSFPEAARRSVPELEKVSYIPCPLCHSSMNRVNFGKLSGVIVDVCRKHGTWFDGGELTRVVAFAASGGLSKARAREQQERKEAEQKHAAARAELLTIQAKTDEPLERWRDFLESLFWF